LNSFLGVSISTPVRFLHQFFPFLFIFVYGSFVLAFCFIQPPFQIPDEPAHFFRATQVSYFDFGPHFIAATPFGGAFLPLALNDFAVREQSREARKGHLKNARERFQQIQADARNQRPVTVTGFIEMPNEVIYHPLYYLPQAVSIAIARAFSDRVYVWFYADRIFNSLTAVLLLGIALWLSRDQQFVLAGIALLPMSISQIASASPDAWQIAGMVLFVSLCIRLRDRGETALQWIAVLLGIWLVTVRPVFLIAVLLAPLCAYARLSRRRVLSLSAAIGIPAVVLAFQWSREAAQAYLGTEAFWHSSPQAQISCLLPHPLRLFPILIHTYAREHTAVYRSFIGILGWTAVEMPKWFYVCAPILLVFIFAAFLVPRRVWSLSGAVAALGFLGVLSATLLSMYLLFTPACINTIYGLQGRYFLAPLALVALVCGTEFKNSAARYLGGASLCVLLMALSLWVSARQTDRKYYHHPIAAASASPKGHIEIPSPHAHVAGRITISGWAAATTAIKLVTVSVDGHDQRSIPCDIARPDVDDAVDGSAPGDKGWKIILDSSSWGAGNHVIAARASAANGQTASLGSIQVVYEGSLHQTSK